MDTEFEFRPNKNAKLVEERGISFDEIIYYINNGCLLDIVKHHNNKKYANQLFYVIDVDSYVYLVPFIKNGSKIFLKTIFPSRKHTKLYLEQLENRGGTDHD